MRLSVSISSLFFAYVVVVVFFCVFLLLLLWVLSPHSLPEGVNGLFAIFFFFGDIASPSVNIISAHLSLALSLISSVILPLCLHFLSFFFFPFSCSPSQTEGRTALPLLKAPSHCKRMSLSHCKQSAFIISYLLRPPRQQSWYEGRASVFGPVACRVKVCSSGK